MKIVGVYLYKDNYRFDPRSCEILNKFYWVRYFTNTYYENLSNVMPMEDLEQIKIDLLRLDKLKAFS